MYIADLCYVLTSELKQDIDANCVATCIALDPKGRSPAFYCFRASMGKKWIHCALACSSHSIKWIDPMRTLGIAGEKLWE